MNIRCLKLPLVLMALFVVPNLQAAEGAASLDELLEMIKTAKVNESREHAAREAKFKNARSEQAEQLKQARGLKAEEEARSEQLEKQYAENELKVAALQEQLQKRLGSLTEMFGHLTSAAGDTRATLNSSVVSSQYPGRTAFLDELIAKMGSNTKLPTLAEIEHLWYEINHEMIESGKVVKFPATVIKADGERVQQEVVRIGAFNLLSNGAYLVFNPETGAMSELVRQPGRKYTRAAAELQVATDGFTQVGVDPTGPSGGSLLTAKINSPTTIERWHQGGLIGYFISFVGLCALVLALWRFVVLTGISRRVSNQLKSDTVCLDNPLGRILQVGEEHSGMDAESLELKLHEQALKERPSIESGLNLLKIIAMLAPLLGLLGTVTGMINTFQAITLFGAGDPQVMAGGISAALVTTVLGLCVAIPTVLLHTLVNGKAQRVLHILEEQSAGIVAEKAEG